MAKDSKHKKHKKLSKNLLKGQSHTVPLITRASPQLNHLVGPSGTIPWICVARANVSGRLNRTWALRFIFVEYDNACRSPRSLPQPYSGRCCCCCWIVDDLFHYTCIREAHELKLPPPPANVNESIDLWHNSSCTNPIPTRDWD